MHRSHKTVSIVIIAVLVFASFSAALAAPAAQDPLPACVADPATGKVAGTVVLVDGENGIITVQQPGGTQCTVNISVDETHPIALLLGMYFGDISSENFQKALDDTQGCATQNPDTTWSWVDCGANPDNIKVTGVTVTQNPDGTYTYTYTAVVLGTNPPQTITFTTTDETTIDMLNGALATLTDLPLEADGSLMLTSDRVMELHNEGMGFGVIVKLLSIVKASEGTVTLEQLLADVQAGMGMGQLFKEYGKPPQVGIGHVRQELKNGDETTLSGQGNGVGNNGNVPPGQEKKQNKTQNNKLKGNSHTLPKGNGKGHNKP